MYCQCRRAQSKQYSQVSLARFLCKFSRVEQSLQTCQGFSTVSWTSLHIAQLLQPELVGYFMQFLFCYQSLHHWCFNITGGSHSHINLQLQLIRHYSIMQPTIAQMLLSGYVDADRCLMYDNLRLDCSERSCACTLHIPCI